MAKRKETPVLFVGEGDFSFTANYITNARNYNEKIYASCLSDSLTERQKRNIEIIEENGGFVFTDVDARHLEYHKELKDLQFSKIVFNFPHIPGKMNIKKNRELVKQFFVSARKILEEDSGTIWVTLCQGQGGTEFEKVKRKWCDTWQIVSLAASASLILYSIKAFDAEAFGTYRCTGFRGLQKSFNTKGALTHIFKCGPPFNTINKGYFINYLDTDLYIQNCETFFRKMSRNLCHPPLKLLSVLNHIIKKMYPSFQQETIDDFLTCRKPSPLKFNLKSITGTIKDFCEDCARNLFFQYLNKKKNDIVCVTCSICCIKIIDIQKDPFYHLVSYFSNDTENLLTSLPALLKDLKEAFSLKRCNDNLSVQNEVLNKKMIKTVIRDTDKRATEEFAVKYISNIYAKYSLNQGNEFFFYSDVDFLINEMEMNEIEVDKILKVGSALHFDYKCKKYTCVLFNLNALACLKYHITDYRTLFSDNSFYMSQLIWGCPVELYRSLSLYPPTYVHDISFYVDEDFCENDFFMVVRNIVGDLIKSLVLIDSYYDEKLNKYSRCYRFTYQSCHQVLSKDKANTFHTDFVRKALAKSLNISLR